MNNYKVWNITRKLQNHVFFFGTHSNVPLLIIFRAIDVSKSIRRVPSVYTDNFQLGFFYVPTSVYVVFFKKPK